MNAKTSQRGFTLVELLVVVVLGALLLMVTYQVLSVNTRVFAVNNARVQGQQTLRAGMDVLFGELREISTPEGDLLDMNANSLTIRAQRAIGLVCAIDYSATPVEITTLRFGPPFETGDSIWVFHDNDPDQSSDDRWLAGDISGVDDSATCSGRPAQTLSVPFVGSAALAASPDTVRMGAPVRGWDVYTYGQTQFEGEWYLARWTGVGSEPDPLVGPLPPVDGVRFRYLDDEGNVTTVDTQVAQIEVTMRYQSEARDQRNELVSDSILVRVYPRN
jgi:prepilin-type N-terminal cleavage/methylation domain-containing protein